MSHSNQSHQKRTPRGSKAASPRPAAPDRKKKAAAPALPSKYKKTAKIAKSLLLHLAEQLSQPPAVNGASIAMPHAGHPPAPPSSSFHSNGGDYHTDYRVEIYGSLRPDGSHLFIIDGRTPIQIDWLQFILLVILASHARTKAKLDAPLNLRGGDFLQPSRIEDIIKQLKEGSLLCAGQKLPASQNAYNADLIRNAKYDLRLRLRRHRKKPTLLDRGGGAGYRISTRPQRIKITLLIDGADDLVFDWQE